MIPFCSAWLIPCMATWLVLAPSPVTAQAALGPDVLRRLDESDGPVKVWVFFADKGLADEAALAQALAERLAGFPPRALARRQLRRTAPGLVDVRDLPVAADYVAAVQAIAGPIHVASRWLNAVSVDVEAAELPALRSLPWVSRVTLVGRSEPPRVDVGPPTAGPSVGQGAAGPAAAAAGDPHGQSFAQLDLVEITLLHAQGYTGAGVVVGVIDTGFVTTHDAFNAPAAALTVLDAYDFMNNDANVGIEPGDDPTQHQHGTMVLGVLGANLSGSYIGAAPDASYLLAKTEDVTQEVPAEEDTYVAGIEWLEQQGADIVSSSLGYINWYTQSDLDGLTATTTVAVNVATTNGVVCCTAAGNSGFDNDPNTSTLIAPADAFDVLTVGAVQITGEIASFSSEGPTADGRVKPEVLGMGDSVVTVWPDDDTSFVSVSGTSVSTPQLAGALACLLQAHPEWSLQTLRERVIKSADYFGAPSPDPLFVTGYGMLFADQALQLQGSWVDLGGALPGSSLPALAGSGALLGDEPVLLAVSGGAPAGTVWMVLGLSLLSAPFKGGTLFPSPDIIVPAVPLDGSGATTLSFPWAPGVPSGASFWVQGWLPDPAAGEGFAATNGLQGTTP